MFKVLLGLFIALFIAAVIKVVYDLGRRDAKKKKEREEEEGEYDETLS